MKKLFWKLKTIGLLKLGLQNKMKKKNNNKEENRVFTKEEEPKKMVGRIRA